MSAEFIKALAKRIDSFLPNKTGYSLAEVELNPQFMVTRSILLSTNTNIFVTDVLSTFCSILDTIDQEANHMEIAERPMESISSTLIVLRLLFDFVNYHWVLKQSHLLQLLMQGLMLLYNSVDSSNGSEKKKKALLPASSSSDFDYSRPFNFSLYYHYEPPKKMDSSIIHRCVETLITLFLNQMAKKTLRIVKISQAQAQAQAKQQQQPQTPSYGHSHSQSLSNNTQVRDELRTSTSQADSSETATPTASETPRNSFYANNNNTTTNNNNNHSNSTWTHSNITSSSASTYSSSSHVASASLHRIQTVQTVQTTNTHATFTTFSTSLTGSSSSTIGNFKKYVADVDNYCSLLLKFIAVSNPEDYYGYIEEKLIHYAIEEQNVPQDKLVKYSPLIEFLFFDEIVGGKIAEVIGKLLKHIKSNHWKQLILVFYVNAVKDQCFSRPEDYNFIVQPGSELEKVCIAMFDDVNNVFEGNHTVGASSMVQAWLVCLCLSDIIEILNKPNKLKISFNKRLKFLDQILSDSQTSTNLESFDSLINIFYLAARLPKLYTDHAVYRFCLAYLDQTYEAINKLSGHFANKPDEIATIYDNLVVNYNVVAVMMNPEKYIHVLTARYYQSLGNVKEMRILVKVVKGLSELKKTQIEFDKVMIKLKGSLKNMISGAVKILYQLSMGNKNSQVVHQLYNNLLLHPMDSQSIKLIDSHNSKSIILPTIAPQQQRSAANSIHSAEIISQTPSVKQFLAESKLGEFNNDDSHFNSNLNLDSNPLTQTVTKTSFSSSSTTASTTRILESTEEILSELFYIFISVPETYFIDTKYLYKHQLLDLTLKNLIVESDFNRIRKFSLEVTKPLMYTFQSSTISDFLLDAACSLSMALVSKNFEEETDARVLLSSFFTLNYLIHYISEACLALCFTDQKFKALFLFLTRFLEYRNSLVENIVLEKTLKTLTPNNRIELCSLSCHSLEKLLLISLCTHDIQFLDTAKAAMKWYIQEISTLKYSEFDTNEFGVESIYNYDLHDRFVSIMEDDSVFTGFISLHKKFRNTLRDVTASQPIFEVWVVILNRWLDLVDGGRKTHSDVENLLLRHYTGFLICLSASFMQDSFFKEDYIQKNRIMEYINQFVEKSILLLITEDLAVRVIIKDALSNEPHPAIYHIISTKMLEIIKSYLEASKYDNEESILFIEQVLTVTTLMIQQQGMGSFVLVALLPDICDHIVKFVSKVQDLLTTFRLKIRFCKLGSSIESDKIGNGVRSAYKIRNTIAKANIEWLQQCIFFEEEHHQNLALKHSNASILTSSSSNSSMETLYLSIDLATECSKALALILEDLPLEIPEGTRDKDTKKAKDIVFATYFSTLYKILKKYTSGEPTSVKLKYKVQLIIDNVIKCISNILRSETDIGMQFVLPLAFNESNRIRSIFLDVFAMIFSERKFYDVKNEFPSDFFNKFTDFEDICGIAAKKASTSEHNLLASSLFTVFGHSNKLDKLFHTLLMDEVSTVSRTTDIFRRNSTLTRILNNFTKEYGTEYLVKTLGPFVEKMNNDNIAFEVEKDSIEVDENGQSDTEADLFMTYFTELVHAITSSTIFAPKSFKFICREIYTCVRGRGDEQDALIAVGSYIFLRFFCPAIISPEAFLSIPLTNSKAQRSLMQLVKLIQITVNGSSIKWPRLQGKINEIDVLNKEIFKFLKDMSCQVQSGQVFQAISESHVPEMRYLHKFFNTYFDDIKINYVLSDSLVDNTKSKYRIERFRELDGLMQPLGLPKSLLALQLNATLKSSELDVNVNPRYADFMAKMALRYADVSPDLPVVHTTIFEDGTPTIVCNLELLKSQLSNDMELVVFRVFEFCLQVWDNKFYLVFDYTESTIDADAANQYMWLTQYYAPEKFLSSCARFYYFNCAFFTYDVYIKTMSVLREEGRATSRVKIYTFSLIDTDFLGKLSLSTQTISAIQDVRVAFHDVFLYDYEFERFVKVTLKIGRKYIQICSDETFPIDESYCETKSVKPVLFRKLKEVTKCEILNQDIKNLDTTEQNQILLQFNFEEQIILQSTKRLEIVRFLYFATSGLPAGNSFVEEDTAKQISGKLNAIEGQKNSASGRKLKELVPFLWFLRLYHAAFQGLLSSDKDVRSSAALLFAALSSYFKMNMGISVEHAKNVALPENTTDFIVASSKYLSIEKPELTYRFFKAFFDFYDKLPTVHRLLAVMYLSPWVDNICDQIHFSTNDGNAKGSLRTADIIRLLCKLTSEDKSQVAYINDYIWKKLFADFRLTTVLLDEIIAYAIDSMSEGPEWSFITTVISPTVELCGELVKRLSIAITETLLDSNVVAKQSKLIEIQILVKISSFVFFELYFLAEIFLPDVFYFCSIFVNHKTSEKIGSDLQKMVNNLIQSFLHKPNITKNEIKTINDTLRYITSQRANLLFAPREKETSLVVDAPHIYHRAASLEVLCDHLLEFLTTLGSSTGLLPKWRAKWFTNTLDLAFNHTSIFQARAILVAGILSKSGVSDFLATRIIKVSSHQKLGTISYLTGQIVSCSRIIQGLNSKSILPMLLFWPVLCLSLLDNIIIYPPTINLFKNTLIKVFESKDLSLDTNMEDYISDCIVDIFKSKKILEPYVGDYEKEYFFRFEPKNIAIYVCFAFLKGLKSSHIKQTSINCMIDYVKMLLKRNGSVYSSLLTPYISFIYLSSTESQFRAFLDEIEHPELMEQSSGENSTSPQFVINFFLSNDKHANEYLIEAANLYKTDTVDSTFKLNFLHLYKDLLFFKKSVGYLVFHIVREELEKTLLSSNSVETVQSASDVLLYAIEDSKFIASKYIEEFNSKLEEFDLGALYESSLTRIDSSIDEETIISKSRFFQEMVYRCSCAYVEGQTLDD